jgi:hypothetical protein
MSDTAEAASEEVVQVKAVAPDSRFHTTNQANHCW